MRNLLFILFSLLLSQAALAISCEVYGISDSPQKLNCQFSGKKVSLRCEDSSGAYSLNGEAVEMAYHEEVEDGPSPLIFKSAQKTLRVLIFSDKNITASYSDGPVTLNGNCRL